MHYEFMAERMNFCGDDKKSDNSKVYYTKVYYLYKNDTCHGITALIPLHA